MDAVLGPVGDQVVAILILVAISIAASLVARTGIGRGMMRWSESSFVGGLPHHRLVKSMADGLAHIEAAESLKPVLASVEGGWRIGYVFETLEKGWVAVFLPESPTAWSGDLMYMPTEHVRPLAITMVEAMTIVKRMGIGSAKALRATDLARTL